MTLESLKVKSNGYGGAREGAGRAKGSKNKKTKEQEVVMDEIRDRVLRSADSLITSQMNLAKGVQMLFKIETKYVAGKEVRSKPILVDDAKEISEYLEGKFEDNSSKEYYFMTTEKPSNQALDSLLDRTFGKAVNKTELTGANGKDLLPTPILEGLDSDV